MCTTDDYQKVISIFYISSIHFTYLSLPPGTLKLMDDINDRILNKSSLKCHFLISFLVQNTLICFVMQYKGLEITKHLYNLYPHPYEYTKCIGNDLSILDQRLNALCNVIRIYKGLSVEKNYCCIKWCQQNCRTEFNFYANFVSSSPSLPRTRISFSSILFTHST